MTTRRHAVLCSMVALLGALRPSRVAEQELPRPYLMLVTFSAPRLRAWTPGTLEMLNESPFAGVASTIVGAYDTDPVPSQSQFESAVAAIKQGAKRDVWPWVFTNRFMGRGARSHTSAGKAAPKYFEDIKGWDLSNRAGAQADFFKLWRLALSLAKELGAPGVVFDMEAYNNYESYSLTKLAECEGLSEAETMLKLRDVGKRMAQVVAAEYPEAVIWSLFLQLGQQISTRYLIEGLLDEAKEKAIPFKLIEGGETRVGYYNPSIEALRQRLQSQTADFAPWLAKYPDHLRLGGTISPYHDPERLTSWIKRQSEQGGRTYQSAAAFRPLFDQLFASCEYLWIYAASASGYSPFSDKCRPVWEPIHAELATLYPKWRAAYRLLPFPRVPSEPRLRERPREFRSLPVAPESWIKGDPNTDLKQGEVTFGLDDTFVKTGPQSLKFHINVNWHEPKGSKYPVGWPMIRRSFDPALDLTTYDVFEFWIYIQSTAKLPKAPLKYGLSNDGKEPLWQKVVTDRTDEWIRVQLPLSVLTNRSKITRLSFYIAERWYRHGDAVTFYIDGVRFLKQVTPEIRAVNAMPIVAASADKALRLECQLAGETAKSALQVELVVTRQGTSASGAKRRLPATGRAVTCEIPIQGWQPGAYVCQAHLLRGEECLDSGKAAFAVVED